MPRLHRAEGVPLWHRAAGRRLSMRLQGADPSTYGAIVMPCNQATAVALLTRANQEDLQRNFPGKSLSEAAQAIRSRFNNSTERIEEFAKTNLGLAPRNWPAGE